MNIEQYERELIRHLVAEFAVAVPDYMHDMARTLAFVNTIVDRELQRSFEELYKPLTSYQFHAPAPDTEISLD